MSTESNDNLISDTLGFVSANVTSCVISLDFSCNSST